jgi:hypothetical protein
MVVHTCNPSYVGSRNGRIRVQGQPEQKLVKPYLKKEAECGGTCLILPAR